MGRHAAAPVFNREYDLRPQRLELIGKVLVAEPQAVKRAAFGWTGGIDLAAGPLVAELAPLVHRLFQRGDRHHLAAQCATSAGSHRTFRHASRAVKMPASFNQRRRYSSTPAAPDRQSRFWRPGAIPTKRR